MLLQRRPDAFRLIRQHDHALLAGALAFSWRSPDGRGPGSTAALATALHDVVWREEDERPRLDRTSGAPYDFVTVPPEEKRRFVERGVERLRAVDPEVGALVGAHHRALGEGTPVDPRSELAWLRFFDNLSLFVCLTPPGSLPDARPTWLRPSQQPPEGRALSLSWQGDSLLLVEPYPFGAPLPLSLPYRDLPARRYRSEEVLEAIWSAAPEQHWALTLIAPGSL